MEAFNNYSLRLSEPVGFLFNSFTSSEVKELSVVKISTPLTFNVLGHPLPGGLYDPALGPVDTLALCHSCKSKQFKCTGHMGHIELPFPVINPLYHKSIASLLKMSCLTCFRVLVPHEVKCLLIGQISLLHHGFVVEAQELASKFQNIHITWERAPSETPSVSVSVSEYVQEALGKKDLNVREWKGEGDLRNNFIKFALGYKFKGRRCPYCAKSLSRIIASRNKLYIPVKLIVAEKFTKKSRKSSTEVTDLDGSGNTYVTPNDCKNYLMELFKNDGEFIKAILPMVCSVLNDPFEVLFMDVIPVSPTNCRPLSILNNVLCEHPQNEVFKAILNDCLVLRTIVHMMKNEEDKLSSERQEVISKLRGASNSDKLLYAWQQLQTNVDSLLDIEALRQRNPSGIGLKQIIEKKEGIIRMNMMGKRVNFAARTVITPDPNLNIDEIGVPEAFAMNLTYPAPVTMFNVSEMRQLIINGPLKHPGANFVVNEDESVVKLDAKDLVQREGIAKKLLTPGDTKGIKIVNRHLMNGDVLLLNRQPTLHRPSIMAHKARVLKGEKTFRLHYANCKSYNADFDGDEMNAHFPQNEVARSEAYNMVSVCNQYLVPKDGTPLSGLIQDHVISGVRLSLRGRFFTRSEYMQLVFQGLSYLQGDIKTLPPSIIKPVQLWSGKQIISTVIINVIPKNQPPINLLSKAKITNKAWHGRCKAKHSKTNNYRTDIMSEAEVVIRGGELLSGVLDKMHYGCTPYSLVHCVYELYGGETSARLLSSLAKLFTIFLQKDGFTLGVEDILVIPKADKKRKDLIQSARVIGDQIARRVVGSDVADIKSALDESYRYVPMFHATVDHMYKISLDAYTNSINEACLPAGLLLPFPHNNLQLMVQSGAKGSTVNTMQISCLLGQIELEGKRPPFMISGRSLPCFPPFETSPRAGGFVDGRFMSGIQPPEFFFHCMAGREGLIDTAVKTSRSGYLQRCLVKHLEGLSVNYDLTVRDSDGSVIQFMYGEDGMEVTKSQFLKSSQIPFLVDNMDAVYDKALVGSLKKESSWKEIKSHKKQLKKWRKLHGSNSRSERFSPFMLFSNSSKDHLSNNFNSETGRLRSAEILAQKWNAMSLEEKTEYISPVTSKSPDTVNSKYQADCQFGSITEKLEDLLNNFLKSSSLHSAEQEDVKNMLYFKAQMSLSHPGDPVGLLAAQSVGEPSTQMTLNTFHFAGRGEMNVTLGIPRLREILMVASKNIKTPSMDIPFRADIPKLDRKANKLKRLFAKITLADVLQSVTISERVQYQPRRCVVTVLTFKFLPHAAYKDKTHVTPKKVLRHVENKFVRELLEFVKQKGPKSKDKKKLITTEISAGGHKEENDEENADDPGEMTGPRRGKALGDGNEYMSSDEEQENEDDDATTARQRARQNEEQQYDDLEDDEVEVQVEVNDGEDDPEGTGKEKEEEENQETELLDNSQVPEVDESEESSRTNFVRAYSNIANYRFDSEKQLWCEVTVEVGVGDIIDWRKLKDLASRSIISEVRGIKRAFVNDNHSGEKILKIDGQNLKEMFWHQDLLDVNRLYCNDIHAVAGTYGIEAAAKVMVTEVQNVFKVYGITVDPRHLTLIADYMTFDGTFKSLSRKGMEGGASPLQQMSFEAALGFLKTSVIRSKRDDLTSPSARLMLGLPIKCGTSAFNLMYSLGS